MNTKKAMIVCGAVLGMIFLILLGSARNGYGYMGYHGYHRGPSFFYWGGPKTYSSRGVRRGSIGGAKTRGGGPGSGK